MHAIIFAERRITAMILSQLINTQAKHDPDSFSGISSDFILGHATGGRKVIDSHMKSKNQNEVLHNFRNSKFNVLLATSVVEEGLDVRQCNMVVRFDKIKNYREYVQSKGRARAKPSKFIVMAEINDMDIEKELKVGERISSSFFIYLFCYAEFILYF